MLFDISDLDAQGRDLDVKFGIPEFEWSGGQSVRCERCRLLATLRKTRRGIELRGRAFTKAHLACSRCLQELTVPVEASFRLFLLPGGEEGSRYEEMDEDDPDAVDLYPLEGTTVDLSQLVREQIDLALPYRVRCEDVGATCQGPADPGALSGDEGEGDERWGDLIRLKERLEKRSEDDEPGAK
jgi:uncharacterized protein